MTYDLTLQKRLAGTVLKVGPKRVRFDPARLNDIKNAITKEDIRQLISEGVISAVPERGISRSRAKKNTVQKSKGLRKGYGKRKGRASARTPTKTTWINRVRAQRAFLKELKEKKMISSADFNEMYRKAKGGFFRSVRHVKLVVNEREMIKK